MVSAVFHIVNARSHCLQNLHSTWFKKVSEKRPLRAKMIPAPLTFLGTVYSGYVSTVYLFAMGLFFFSNNS